MKTAIVCALTLIVALATSAAADEPTRAKPSSLAPRGHSGKHVYGAPIQPRILSRHAKHKRAGNASATH